MGTQPSDERPVARRIAGSHAPFWARQAYAVEDTVHDPASVRRKNLFSRSAIARWWLSGAFHGYLITWIMVLCFEVEHRQFPCCTVLHRAVDRLSSQPFLPIIAKLDCSCRIYWPSSLSAAVPQEMTPRQAGIRILCMQSFVLSSRYAFVSNRQNPY